MDIKNLYWQNYLIFESELIDISYFIHICDNYTKVGANNTTKCIKTNSQLNVFSSRLADLLLRINIEIESISKEIYKVHFGSINEKDKYDLLCLNELNKKLNFGNSTIICGSNYFDFVDNENKSIKPLLNVYKASKPFWKRSYQEIKHDRYNNIEKGNLKSVIHSLGALYLLNLILRNDKIVVTNNTFSSADFTFGSKLFSINVPKNIAINDALNNVFDKTYKDDNCLFSLRLSSASADTLRNIKEDEIKKTIEFLESQPEWRDERFQQYLIKAKQHSKNTNYSPFIELYKYRFNDMFSRTNSFDEKKQILIQSDAYLYTSKHHNLKEITDNNIDSVVQTVCYMFGMKRFAEITSERINFVLTKAKWEYFIK